MKKIMVGIILSVMMVSFAYAEGEYVGKSDRVQFNFYNSNIENVYEEAPESVLGDGKKEEYNWLLRAFAGGTDLLPPLGFPEEDFDTHMMGMELYYKIKNGKSLDWYLGLGAIQVGTDDAVAPGLGVNILARWNPFWKIFLGAGGGLYYLANPADLSALSDKQGYGKLMAEIGFNLTDRFSIAWSVEHLSGLDPNDCGVNVGAVTLGVAF